MMGAPMSRGRTSPCGLMRQTPSARWRRSSPSAEGLPSLRVFHAWWHTSSPSALGAIGAVLGDDAFARRFGG